MRQQSNRVAGIFLLLAVSIATFSTSCKKSKMARSSIYQTISSDPQYSLLTAAVTKAGLMDALNGSGKDNLTLFAPNNDAFKAAGFNSPADLNKIPDSTLTSILLYHVLGTEVMAAGIPVASNTPVTTLNGTPLYATRTGSGKVYVNGVMVVKADIQCTNGVIHAINRVLLPATGNIVETAIQNPDLSLLVAAVLRASQGSTNVAEVLSGTGPFTVFAPNNQAFIEAGFPDENSINAADPDVLASILTYHVLSGRVFSSDLSDGLMPAALNGEKLLISLSGGATVKGNGNSTGSNIIATDILAENGVVHLIDQVLLP